MFDPKLCQPKAYFADLVRRLADNHLSMNQLGAACVPPISPTQLSRWKNKGIDPLLSSVGKIETAFHALLDRKAGARGAR